MSTASAPQSPISLPADQAAASLLRFLTDNRELANARPARVDTAPVAPPPAMPAPADPSQPPYADDPEYLAWVARLLKGKSDEQAHARTEIGLLLEARGFIEDAEEIYWTNVQARSTDRRAYNQLMAIYRQRRDRLSETLVQRQYEEVFGELDARQAAPPTQYGRRRTDRIAADRDDDGDDRRGAAMADGGPVSAARVRRLRRARRDDVAPKVTLPDLAPAKPVPSEPAPSTSMLGLPVSPNAAPAATTKLAAATAPLPAQPAMSMLGFPVAQAPAQPAAPARRSLQVVPRQPQALVMDPIFDDLDDDEPVAASRVARPAGFGQPRRVSLAQNRRPFLRSGGLVAVQPMTIGAFLLASIGAAALIAMLLLFGPGRGVANAAPNPAASNQLPPRCADASLRFPGANDPRAAVAAAYRANGVDVDAVRPGSARLTPAAAEQVIGGWVGVSLLLERAGQTAPTLAAWLSQDSGGGPTLANAMISGRSIDGLLTANEWAQVQALPANTCEGAFLRNPQNAALAQLVNGVIIH